MTDRDSKKDCDHLEIPQSIPRGFLRHIIPRLLKERDMTGTQIMQEFNDRTNGEWNPSPGTIYPLLSSLEKSGIIKTVKVEGRSKTYHLTDDGRKRVERAFKRRQNRVGQKTRMGPRLWEQFLNPSERVRFHIHGTEHGIETFESIAQSLKSKDKDLLLKHLKKLNAKISSLIDSLEKGGN